MYIETTNNHPSPRGGCFCYVAGHGKAWIQSVSSLKGKGTALVQFSGGMRGARKVPLSHVDFTRQWRWQDQPAPCSTLDAGPL